LETLPEKGVIDLVYADAARLSVRPCAGSLRMKMYLCQQRKAQG
jgi:hypothetical protein